MTVYLQSADNSLVKAKALGWRFWVLALVWTLLIGGFAAWNFYRVYHAGLKTATAVALDNFNKDLTYRQWSARSGGVYVPVSAATPPNPYLLDIPERDLTTPSGRQLTLVNPAYMNRQVYELARERYKFESHITSLKPIRPQNAADPWETLALQAFEKGSPEIASLEQMNGKPYLRFMRPLTVEDGCLKCHARQGYRKGEIRGGISVSVPWLPYRETIAAQWLAGSLFYGGTWLLGLIGLVVAWRFVQHYLDVREQADAALRQAKDDWESTFNSLTDMVTIQDKDFNILRANNSASQMLSLDLPENHAPAKCFRYYHGTEKPPECCASCKSLETGIPGCVEVFEPHLGRHLEIRAIPRFDDQHQCIGLVHIVRDISDRKRAEEALCLQARELRARNDELSRFNQVAVGRELRMIDLKREVNELCSKLGDPPRYRVSDEPNP